MRFPHPGLIADIKLFNDKVLLENIKKNADTQASFWVYSIGISKGKAQEF